MGPDQNLDCKACRQGRKPACWDDESDGEAGYHVGLAEGINPLTVADLPSLTVRRGRVFGQTEDQRGYC